MEKFITYGSIEQFKSVVRNITYTAQYVGLDEDKNPIMDRDAKLPILECTASEKIHGTNAAVCFNKGEFWVQSRKNIITPEKDNAGCAFTAYANKDQWMKIINDLVETYKIDIDNNTISVFFEWAGGNIQKNSALTGIDKKALIFQYFKVSPNDEEQVRYWLKTNPTCTFSHVGIYNIMNFPVYKFVIDFNNAKMYHNSMIDLVSRIEENSPVGLMFEQNGNIGEGIVVTLEYKDSVMRFKVKGEKHSASKVKTLKPVDNELEQKKIDFVNNNACTSSRLEQCYTEVMDLMNGGEGDIKKTGDFMRWLINDTIKEESDTLNELGLIPKDVNSMISKVARTWLMERLNGDL